MKHPNIVMSVFESPEELARGAAEEWLGRIQAETGDRILAALPGGRIYKLFFRALADEARKIPGVLDRVHFLWGDERCVPPDDGESNFRLAEEMLLKPLGIRADHVHRIRGEIDPAAAAREAEQKLLTLAPPAAAGVPQIDYIFLGMGEDGHVASLFPGEPPDVVNSGSVFRAVTGPKPPPRRVTLSYRTIAAARNVWVLIAGAGKEGALRQSIAPGGATPLARVLGSREKTLVLTDINLPGSFSPAGR
jgi:6-phosphogluconolactonase